MIDNTVNNLDDLIAFRGRGLHKAEKALLKFLKRGSQGNGLALILPLHSVKSILCSDITQGEFEWKDH